MSYLTEIKHIECNTIQDVFDKYTSKEARIRYSQQGGRPPRRRQTRTALPRLLPHRRNPPLPATTSRTASSNAQMQNTSRTASKRLSITSTDSSSTDGEKAASSSSTRINTYPHTSKAKSAMSSQMYSMWIPSMSDGIQSKRLTTSTGCSPTRPTTGSINIRNMVTSPKPNWITLQDTRETSSSLKPKLFRKV